MMRITLNIEDQLLDLARDITGVTSESELIRKALEVLLERESARKLAKSGGSQPRLQPIPRRRFNDNPD